MLNNGNKTKPGTTISLVIVFTVCMVLTVIRWLDIFNADIYVINETVNSHHQLYFKSAAVHIYRISAAVGRQEIYFECSNRHFTDNR